MPQELLDLPTEMFRMIIHAIVTELGAIAAWRLREVCRTFAVEIHDDIFTCPPEIIIQQDQVFFQHFIQRNMGLYLSNLAKTSSSANGPLMHKLKELLGYVTELLGIHIDADRQECACKLFHGLIDNGVGDFRKLIWPNCNSGKFSLAYDESMSESLLDPIQPHEKLAAAVSVGSRATVTALFRPEINVSSFYSGKPLDVAVRQHDEEMVHTLVECYARWNESVYNDLANAIRQAIRQDSPTMVHVLLGHWNQVKGTPVTEKVIEKEDHQTFLIAAAWVSSIRIIDMVLDSRKLRKGPLPREEVDLICTFAHVSVLEHYIRVGRIDPNKTWHNSSPLIMAFNNSLSSAFNVTKVRALLMAGADINKAAGNGATALYTACRLGMDDIARYLLSQGADADLSGCPHHKTAIANLKKLVATDT